MQRYHEMSCFAYFQNPAINCKYFCDGVDARERQNIVNQLKQHKCHDLVHPGYKHAVCEHAYLFLLLHHIQVLQLRVMLKLAFLIRGLAGLQAQTHTGSATDTGKTQVLTHSWFMLLL